MKISPGELLVDIAAAAIKKIRNRPKAVARRAAKAARKAKRPRQLDEASGEFFQPDEDRTMLAGSKSWIGIAGMLVGFLLSVFGIGECSPDAIAAATCVPADTITADLMAALDKIITGVFAVVTIVGIVHKQIREKRLKAQLAAQTKQGE